MRPELLLQELEALCEKLGVTIRYEEGNFSDGYCRLKDDKLLIVHKKIPTAKKVQVIARELAQFDISDLFILPAVREIIDEYQDKTE